MLNVNRPLIHPLGAAILSALALTAGPFGTPVSSAAELRTLENQGRTLDYFLSLPDGFDSAKPYPVLLAIPPGDQTRELAQTGLDKYWEAEAKTRGWVIISPIAQKSRTFHSGLERSIPFLLDDIARTVTFEGGRAHLAGVSNGGKSAFRIATEFPNRFLSLTVLPGFPPDDRAELGLRSLKALPGGVAMHVGENDRDWLAPSRLVKQKLEAYGVPVTLEVWPGGGHVLDIKAIELFDVLDTKRVRPIAAPDLGQPVSLPATANEPAPPGSVATPPGSVATPAAAPAPVTQSPTPATTTTPAPGSASLPPPAPIPAPAPAPPPPAQPAARPQSLSAMDLLREETAVSAVLDNFHDAAAKADESRYFAHFAPEGVFIGTDATERWDLPAFRAFASPYFQKGKAWTYRSTERKITIAPGSVPGAEFAWFDEMLENDHLGVTRGSGVLRKIDGQWKISQYNLSIPLPNDLVDQVVPMIRAKSGAPATP